MSDLPRTGGERWRAFRSSKLYDLIAALPVIAWFGFCVVQGLPPLLRQAALARLFVQTDVSYLPPSLVLDVAAKATVLAFQALLVVLFVIRTAPRAGALDFLPRFAAIAGTFLGIGIVLLPPRELSAPFQIVSLLLMIGGFAFMIWAAICLGRSISLLPQARRLVTSGPYFLVRHPLYAGEAVAVAGMAMQYVLPWSLLIVALQYAFQLLRLRYEERVLEQAFADYAAYAKRTARLIPGIY
jgi:protein-S-isoprenylcysteine O-methyltransferase Ste14